MSTAVFSAGQIAELIADSGPVLLPTSEQERVIEHHRNGTALVIAGAGSGKTETMAARVLWLIANRYAMPSQILGLTFTRKAAGELADRVHRRILTFSRCAEAADSRGELTPEQAQRARELRVLLEEELELPEISTYNSFAAGIVQEFGGIAGTHASGGLLDEASAWSLARDVVVSSEHPGLGDAEMSIETLTARVLDLDRSLSEHVSSPAAAIRELRACREHLARLPKTAAQRAAGVIGEQFVWARTLSQTLASSEIIANLAEVYAQEKRRFGLLEYSDQVRLARETISRAPGAKTELRRRTAFVLLDEVQDTSYGQTMLLSEVFSGANVMAVGDPHQSIYGWRGASSASLTEFHRSFTSRDAAQLSLSTSWRNATRILDAANTLAGPLRAESLVPVSTLNPKPGAPEGSVACAFPETLREECELVADWVKQQRERFEARTGAPPTAALVFRKREHMHAFATALTDAGVPCTIVGAAGLLSTPEATDLVATLRCLWFADAGSELIRLLTGPRFLIGVADVHALHRAARWLSERHEAGRPEHDGVVANRTAVTLLDALDVLPEAGSGHPAFSALSDEGRTRMIEAARMLRTLRLQVSHDLYELTRAVEQALRLDIELEANDGRATTGAMARANLDAFETLIDQFLAVSQDSTLRSFLMWVERATHDDTHAEYVPPPQPGTVQLITAHSAKGLEWDIVVVPRLVEQEFPTRGNDRKGWLRVGKIPDACRGDRAVRPHLGYELADTQKELSQRITAYEAENADLHEREERRLVYVAVTRARELLLLTGSYWSGLAQPRNPSPFLSELADTGQIAGLPNGPRTESAPDAHEERTLMWPLDPLGRRRTTVLAAAAAVRAKLDAEETTSDPLAQAESVDPTLALLLRERAADAREHAVTLPGRINASAFHEFVGEPTEAAQRALRPMPIRPYRKTKTGNLFHAWVERRTTTALGTTRHLTGLGPEFEDFPLSDETEWLSETGQPGDTGESVTADSPDDASDDLTALIAQFERSRWATRAPIAVELEITVPFADRRVVCKLDAVYADGDRIEIVDWKTGRAPRTDAEREQRLLQLELYRIAYAAYAEIPLERIDVTLFYVAENIEITGSRVRTIAELEEAWREATSASSTTLV